NGGRMDEILTWLGKYGVHTVAFGAGVAIVVLAPDPAEKAAGALLAIIAWKKVKGYFGGLMNAGLGTVKVGFGSIWSDKNGNATDETITFMSGEPYTATLNMQRRNATTGNQSDTAEGFVNFFNTFDLLSEAVNKLNGVIEFVNDHVFFANISLVPVFTMPADSPLITETAETDSYESLQFSVADPGVEIGNVSFADGEISITLNVVNDEDSIETTLNYTYDDEFSHFTGSFPVVVTSACANSDLAVPLTGNGNAATGTATGGVPPYTYAWSNSMTGATITGLEPGIYVVTATDAIRCTALANVQIEDVGEFNLFTDAAAVKAIRMANGLDVSDPRWDSGDENEVIAVLAENHANVTNNRVVKLSFGFLNLTTIPETIGNLTNLTELNLRHNQLTTLPETIGNLTNLMILTMDNNQLTTMPEAIGNLTNLTELILVNNQLTTLPATIGNLTNLIILNLDTNQLSTIPETIGNLTNLTTLFLSQNQLSTIPETMGNLTNLTDLNLYSNQLTTVPGTIGNLTNLLTIKVTYNPNLKCLPIEVWNLPCDIYYEGSGITEYGDTDCSH